MRAPPKEIDNNMSISIYLIRIPKGYNDKGNRCPAIHQKQVIAQGWAAIRKPESGPLYLMSLMVIMTCPSRYLVENVSDVVSIIPGSGLYAAYLRPRCIKKIAS